MYWDSSSNSSDDELEVLIIATLLAAYEDEEKDEESVEDISDEDEDNAAENILIKEEQEDSLQEETEITQVKSEPEDEQQSEEEIKAKRRRVWVKPVNQKREIFGKFHQTFSDIKNNEKKFFQHFHMTCNKFNELLNILEPALTFQNTNFRASVTKEERLAVTLRFLVRGESFRTIAHTYNLGESTVRSIIYTTCDGIWDILGKMVMPTPTKEIWKESEEQFRNLWDFPNCVATIVGQHVVTDKAPNVDITRYNYIRNTFSIVWLALIDAHSKFIAVDVAPYGNVEGGLFSNSVIGKQMQQDKLDFPEDKPLPGMDIPLPYVFVGDERFHLYKHLLRPYKARPAQKDLDMKTFNDKLSQVRKTVDHCFDMLVQRFRVYHKRFQIGPENLDKIVLATCCLHNFLYDDRCYWSVSKEKLPKPAGLHSMSGIGGNATGTAMYVRDTFKLYFSMQAQSSGVKSEVKVETEETTIS